MGGGTRPLDREHSRRRAKGVPGSAHGQGGLRRIALPCGVRPGGLRRRRGGVRDHLWNPAGGAPGAGGGGAILRARRARPAPRGRALRPGPLPALARQRYLTVSPRRRARRHGRDARSGTRSSFRGGCGRAPPRRLRWPHGRSGRSIRPGWPIRCRFRSRLRTGGAALARVLRGVLARNDPAGAAAIPLVLQASDLRVSTGAGGWVTQVGDAEGRWRISGDAFARAADAAAGRGVVRSSRFTLSDAGQSVAFHGSGRGHGVGLCQLGAARRAAAGEGYRSILRWYFPRAKLEPSP